MTFDPVDKNQKQFSAFNEKKSSRAAFNSAKMYFDSGLEMDGYYCSFFLEGGNFICVPSLTSYDAGNNVIIKFTGEEIFRTGLKTRIIELDEEIPLEIFTSGMPVIE